MKKAVIFAVIMMSLTTAAFAGSASESFGENVGHFFHNVWPGNWPMFGGQWE